MKCAPKAAGFQPAYAPRGEELNLKRFIIFTDDLYLLSQFNLALLLEAKLCPQRMYIKYRIISTILHKTFSIQSK